MNTNINPLESFTAAPESIDDTLASLKQRTEQIGKNPIFAEDYQDLLKTIENIEKKSNSSKN